MATHWSLCSGKYRIPMLDDCKEFSIHVMSQTEEWKHLTLDTEPRGMLNIFTKAIATVLVEYVNSRRYH